MSITQELADMFQRGALVQFFYTESGDDPPPHAVAGLWPVDDTTTICWDSGIGLNYKFVPTEIEKVRDDPLTVKITVGEGYVLASVVGSVAQAEAEKLRPTEQEMLASYQRMMQSFRDDEASENQ